MGVVDKSMNASTRFEQDAVIARGKCRCNDDGTQQRLGHDYGNGRGGGKMG